MDNDPLLESLRQLPAPGPPPDVSEAIRAQAHVSMRRQARGERSERWLRAGEVLLAAAVALVYLRWAAQTTSLLGL